jgi:sec-independent protein translocase protein TatC
MPSSEEPKGPNPPETGATPDQSPLPGDHHPSASEDHASGETHTSYSPTVDDPYNYYDDPYHAGGDVVAESTTSLVPAPIASAPPASPPKPPKEEPKEEADEDDDGMLRMSFMQHLEELRSRLIRALAGLGVAFVVCLLFANELWKVVSEPAIAALKKINPANPNLVMLAPIDGFSTIWVKLPLLAAVFLASPWVLYQVWAFIAPGLYKKERKWAAPFVICTAGLFILGGTFAYFVAFRYGLEFLLGIGSDIGVVPNISIVEYLDLFINVMLGVGLVFEMPILIFFLTLLRIVTPKFLLENSRYAILIITVIAAVVTPTPDIFNLMLFAVPMVLLYFVGVFASYILWLRREKEKFPWRAFLIYLAVAFTICATVIYLLVVKYGFKLIGHWPFLTR